MADGLTEAGASYSSLVGLIYVFNLIVGTGALTMPNAFGRAGWLVSTVIVCALCFMSYMTVTFVIETMAAANAIRKYTREQIRPDIQASSSQNTTGDVDANDETKPLLSVIRGPQSGSMNEDQEYYEITERIEMSQMAEIFFNKAGMYLFYLCIIVYLYGDLAIYAAAVPKSLRDVACTWMPNSTNASTPWNEPVTDCDICWSSLPSVNRGNAYRIFLVVFVVPMGGFMFFNVQKTKYLQHFTTAMRWLAFSMMIVLALIRLGKGEGRGHPPAADFTGLPTLFGVCVYSFMCHHSLPSLTTPIRNKSKLTILFAGDYLLILIFYCLLSITGVFSFSALDDLYTLNFQHNTADPITNIQFIQYFLALFPVFTLSTNFPIIGITLRNNLKTMCLCEDREYNFVVRRILFPLLTIIPPTVVAFITNKVDFLVGITGSYAGAGIQYFVPALLVFCARRTTSATLGPHLHNQYVSPFKHSLWFIFTLIWGIVCIVFVTVNHIITRK